MLLRATLKCGVKGRAVVEFESAALPMEKPEALAKPIAIFLTNYIPKCVCDAPQGFSISAKSNFPTDVPFVESSWRQSVGC